MQGLLLMVLVAFSLECGTAIDTYVYEAKCVMDPANSADWQMVGGTVRLRQVGDGPVVIYVQLSGFNKTDGIFKHGMHIHEKGDVSNKCADLGPHYNPDKVNHGGRQPWEKARHPGDFGNLVEQGDLGEIYDTVSDTGITLIDKPNRYNIIGRSLDVHVGEDDLGLPGTESSLWNGNAGPKVACCKIQTATASDFLEASCNMQESSPGAVPTEVINGTVSIKQLRTGGMTSYDIDLDGFKGSDGIKHGFHVHKNGSTDNKCAAAEGHFNPLEVNHGGPSKSLTGTTGTTRHVGDLGNVNEKSGKIVTTITDMKSGMLGDHSILNRALVVHERADDLGLVDSDASRGSGDAGKRLGCCVIIQSPDNIVGGTAAHRGLYTLSLLLPAVVALLAVWMG